MVATEQYSSARQGEYKCKATFWEDGTNNNHLSTFVTQQCTNLVLQTTRKVFGMVIATVKHSESSYQPRHWRGMHCKALGVMLPSRTLLGATIKSLNNHNVKMATTVSWSKSTRDALYLFLVHIGRGRTHRSCFWSTLPGLDFAIFAMVACGAFCRDNGIGRTYSLCLLAPHIDLLFSHDFQCKRLEFRSAHKISCYLDDVHPTMNPCAVRHRRDWFAILLYR